VAVAAGWIAHTDSWVDFQADWDKAGDLDGDKFDSMHMAKFVFGRKGTEFERWSLEKKQRISARLRGIIKNKVAKGFALGIVKKDFDELVPKPPLVHFLPRSKRPKKTPLVVGARGFEPRTSCAQGRRATRLRYAPT
jgi:hypothetical protein